MGNPAMYFCNFLQDSNTDGRWRNQLEWIGGRSCPWRRHWQSHHSPRINRFKPPNPKNFVSIGPPETVHGPLWLGQTLLHKRLLPQSRRGSISCATHPTEIWSFFFASTVRPLFFPFDFFFIGLVLYIPKKIGNMQRKLCEIECFYV